MGELFCLRKEASNEIEMGPCYLPPHVAGKLPHELVALGWYVAVRRLPDTFDDINEYMNDPEVEWGSETDRDIVILTYSKRRKTDEEKRDGIDEFMTRTVRAERNALLSGSDWTQLRDAPLTDEEKVKWTTYRQSLRDMSLYAKDNSIWPISPKLETTRA